MLPSAQAATLPGACLLIAGLLAFPIRSQAYSVFTHEQLIDLAWKPLIEPLLRSRFPHATADELRDAHAYAYGGSAIQDMGYYPFGKEFFSNLTHYVRTGDFIMSLLRNSRTVQEYAFAIGAYSHYVGDNIGHHDAINRSVALAFPKLAQEHHEATVTYGQGPHAHVRVEFAFDIEQLSRRRLAPSAYLRFIGLKVSRRLLEQSFREVYALPLGEVLGPTRPATRSYRTSVRTFLPQFAYSETILHRNSFPPDPANEELEEYLKRINATEFEKIWSPYRRKARLRTYLLAFVIKIVPKIGAVSDLAIKIPTEQTNGLYIASVNRSVELFEASLTNLKARPKTIAPIPNRDLDTGERTKPGAYARSDETYAKLLHDVVSDPGRPIPEPLRQDVLNYYADPATPNHVKKNKKKWKSVGADLVALRGMKRDGTVSGR